MLRWLLIGLLVAGCAAPVSQDRGLGTWTACDVAIKALRTHPDLTPHLNPGTWRYSPDEWIWMEKCMGSQGYRWFE